MPKPNDSVGFLIADAARLMRATFDRRVRQIGLTRAQWQVLSLLHHRPGASQTELADGIGIVPVAVGLFGLSEILMTAGQAATPPAWLIHRAEKASALPSNQACGRRR